MSDHEILDCIKTGDPIRAKRLLTENKSLAKTDADGVSALLLSVYYGAEEIQSELEIALGDELNIQEAAAVGNLNLLQQRLAENPAQINEFSNDGYFPLGYACFFGRLECVRYLLDTGANVNQHANNPQRVAPIHAACANGNLEIVKMIIDAGADVNSQQANGFRPLHTAASENRTEIARMLLNAGADPTLEDDFGTAPAQMAEQKGHADMAKLLGG